MTSPIRQRYLAIKRQYPDVPRVKRPVQRGPSDEKPLASWSRTLLVYVFR